MLPDNKSIALFLGLICLFIYLGLRIAVYAFEVYCKKREFEIKMMMTEAQTKSTATQKYDELLHILDYNISFCCLNESLYVNRQKMTEEELDVLISETAAHISAKVIHDLSEEMQRQLQIYVTNDWLEYSVTKSTVIKLTSRLENTPRS